SHGHRLADAERVADGESIVADLNIRRIPDHDSGQIGSINLEDGEIDLWIGADHASFVVALVGQRHFHVGGAIDHVVVSEDIAIRADDYARAEAALALFARHLRRAAHAA